MPSRVSVQQRPAGLRVAGAKGEQRRRGRERALPLLDQRRRAGHRAGQVDQLRLASLEEADRREVGAVVRQRVRVPDLPAQRDAGLGGLFGLDRTRRRESPA